MGRQATRTLHRADGGGGLVRHTVLPGGLRVVTEAVPTVRSVTFGAFVSLMPGRDGLLHISKLRALAGGKRVDNVDDVVKVGDKVQVQIAEVDSRGKLSLVPVEADGDKAPAADASDEA